NCDLTIDATHKKSGVYALAITIEDKPTSTITIGSTTIKSFSLLDPPTNVRQSALRNDDMFRPDVYAMDLTWTPLHADKGSKTICVEATDNFLMSTQHCVTLVVWDNNPCDSSPCKHNGTCDRQGYKDNYKCACVPGFTGHDCKIALTNDDFRLAGNTYCRQYHLFGLDMCFI
ncbi:hypothetical protein MAR_013343, partial [Mya arenaria]